MAKWIGYHGTSASNISSIQKAGYALSDAKQWFGVGVYFFGDLPPISDGKSEARLWMLNVKHEQKWAVFRALIASEKIFDLVESAEDKELYGEIRAELFRKHCASGKDPNIFRDLAVMRQIELANVFEVVRSIVDAAKHNYPAYVMTRPQLQICVKQLNAISRNELIEHGVGNVIFN